ncbi:MAG TPA: Fe-S cluster assembly protein SufD [Gammaproteobacteria bacterium]|jgi:Fe-S cluster assembly protein SufD|nr:Fe-S cluster assembly protein SufD [Gammaproteobacteria bacterium]
MIALDNSSALARHFAEQATTGAGLEWLQQQRNVASAHFAKIGLPEIKDEEWRYTNLRQLKSTPLQTINQEGRPSVDLPDSDNQRLVFIDGVFSAALSSFSKITDYVMPMSKALEEQPQVVQEHFGKMLPAIDEQHGFTALNSAFFHDGYVVLLPNNTVLEEPIEMLFVAGQNEQASMSHSRNLIVLGSNSQCTIVERFIAKQGSVYLANVVTEVAAGDNAHLDHYKIQQESDDAFHVGAVFMNQAANSQLATHNVTLTGLVTRNDIVSNLQGQGSHIEMNGLVIGHARQHIDSVTQVNHLVPNTTSDEFYKTILDDSSRAVFRGRIVVAQDAQLTNADQTNNNLLLSDTAEADSKPQLEIYADDVKCSHGATVGQLDEKSLFYLNSRGINNESARALLTFAFANEVVERVKVDSIREELTQLIAGELLEGLADLV